tara:strand:- start:975 stop:1349 length:375 start_codon:yes stop_codon:yes gene_type:complete
MELNNSINSDIKSDINSEEKKDYVQLERIRKIIELLDKTHHIEIGKILKQNKIKLSENNNGIFINLSTLDTKVVLEIEEYLEFIKKQEKFINIDEGKKEELENNYFKNIKDNTIELNVEQTLNV